MPVFANLDRIPLLQVAVQDDRIDLTLHAMHAKTSCLTWHDRRRAASRHRTAAPRQAGSWRRPATQTFPGLRAEVRLLREVAGLSQHLASHPPSSLRHTDRLAHEMMSRCRRSIIGRRSREGAGAHAKDCKEKEHAYVAHITTLEPPRCPLQLGERTTAISALVREL